MNKVTSKQRVEEMVVANVKLSGKIINVKLSGNFLIEQIIKLRKQTIN